MEASFESGSLAPARGQAYPRRLKRLKRLLRYAALRVLWAAVELLPVRRASELGAWFGRVVYRLAGAERDKTLDSLRRAFPLHTEPQRVALARACFEHLGRCAFELVCIRQIDREMDAWVEWPVAERQRLEEMLARKKGIIFVTGHVGSWELLARRVALAGFPCHTIAKESSDPRLTAAIERLRSSVNIKSIWRGQAGAAKQMLRALKAGDLLGLLIDQDTKVQSVFVPFFGHLAATPRAAADLALRTGAAIAMGFCQREKPGRYRISIEEVPLPAATDDRDADATALTARLTERIEAAIRRAPEQWVWMHRRWKTPPPEAKP